IDGVDLDVEAGKIHGLIGPNGSGKTTILNVISGFYGPEAGSIALGGEALKPGDSEFRASRGIARTFQTPRIVGEATVLQNVMIGGTIRGQGTFLESLLFLPRHRRDEAMLRSDSMMALSAVGLDGLAEIRADRLQHSELRFM